MPTAKSLLPEGFALGVAISGFQAEGGFNGPGEPANNWARFERLARVEPSGIAVGWWDLADEYLDRAASLGCDMVRLGIEWARIEPAEGEYDQAAVDGYVSMIEGCRKRGMRPLVTLHHFTHPEWLGEDFWLSPESPARFAGFAQKMVPLLAPHCEHWVTLNEVNAVAMATYLFGLFPPARNFAIDDSITASANLLAAHVATYDILHRVQPGAFVTTNNAGISLYELDRQFTDILLARRSGIKREDLVGWLESRRNEWYGLIAPPKPLESLARSLSKKLSLAGRPEPSAAGRAFAKAVDAIYESSNECTLDFVGFDYYDPVASNHVSIPGSRTAGGRNWSVAQPLWDDAPDPSGLTLYCHAHSKMSPGLPIWIVENGMCTRVRNGRAYPRIDGWDRPRYIRENVGAALRALDEGVPLGGYLHWSLVDNYEWGSYQPRFGIYGVDRERGIRILETDAAGHDAAGAYRRVIEGLRNGDRSVVS
ncbi:MAG TPA: family 1 glycosylhydrolase [Acidimicrobiales bacterium]|nr:family 1 glycosylhydrolase [Acidimicrobiales bacterium]